MNEDLTKKLPQSDSEKLTLILTTVQNLEVRLETLEQRVDNIDSRLQRLEQRVEQRLHDTRPIWHKVVADIAQLQVGQQRLEEGQEALRLEVHELKSLVREVNRDQIVINQVIRRIQLDSIKRDPSNSST
jgi:chaperonin cofactor prefoldin